MATRPNSRFDEPALVVWSVKGPLDLELPANVRYFDTLREAVLHIRGFPHGTRSKMTIQTRKKEYGPAEIEELYKEMREQI